MNTQAIQAGLGALAFVVLALSSREASACHEATVCVKFKVASVDLGVGDYPDQSQDPDDNEGEAYLSGAGVRVMLLPPPPEAPFEVVTDSSGCFDFMTEWVEGHKLVVYPEAFLGDNYNIHITAHDSYDDAVAGTLAKPWFRDLHSVGQGDVVTATIEPKALSPLFGWAVWITERTESALSPGLSGARTMRLASVGGPWPGSYTGREIVYVSSQSLRFEIAHEIGHWYHQNWADWDLAGNFDAHSAEDEECKWDGNHGIRSAEEGNAASQEGFAQFFAAWVFDNPAVADARFLYYKEIPQAQDEAYEDFVAGEYQVSLLGGDCNPSCPVGGQSQWVKNECSATDGDADNGASDDWNNNAGFMGQDLEVSTEMDWMRFFWQFVSAEVETFADPNPGPDPVPSLNDLFDLLDAAAAGVTPNYGHYHDTITTDIAFQDYVDRFEDLADANGLDNGGI